MKTITDYIKEQLDDDLYEVIDLSDFTDTDDILKQLSDFDDVDVNDSIVKIYLKTDSDKNKKILDILTDYYNKLKKDPQNSSSEHFAQLVLTLGNKIKQIESILSQDSIDVSDVETDKEDKQSDEDE